MFFEYLIAHAWENLRKKQWLDFLDELLKVFRNTSIDYQLIINALKES